MDRITRLARQLGLPEELVSSLVKERAESITEQLAEGAPLPGVPISLSEAARKYAEPGESVEGLTVNLGRWAKQRRIRVLQERTPAGNSPLLIDERDAAVAIRAWRRQPGRGYRPLSRLAHG